MLVVVRPRHGQPAVVLRPALHAARLEPSRPVRHDVRRDPRQQRRGPGLVVPAPRSALEQGLAMRDSRLLVAISRQVLTSPASSFAETLARPARRATQRARQRGLMPSARMAAGVWVQKRAGVCGHRLIRRRAIIAVAKCASKARESPRRTHPPSSSIAQPAAACGPSRGRSPTGSGIGGGTGGTS